MLSVLTSASKSWDLVERFCFPAPKPSYDLNTYPNELIMIPRDDGISVPCLFLPFAHARFLFIYFHGNGEDLGTCHRFCCILRNLFQIHIIAVEYPGYGLCTGTTTEAGIMANASAVLRFVTTTLAWPLDSVKLLGRSLGTAPAIALATVYAVSGVILVSPFLSIREIARSQIGSLSEFIEDWFPNYQLSQHILSPTLVIHGQKDRLVPCEHGRKLFARIPVRKMMVCPPNMAHNSCLLKNVTDFLLPMTEFFPLPDYAFEPIVMPAWAFPMTEVCLEDLGVSLDTPTPTGSDEEGEPDEELGAVVVLQRDAGEAVQFGATGACDFAATTQLDREVVAKVARMARVPDSSFCGCLKSRTCPQVG